MKDTRVVPFLCTRCRQGVVQFSRTGGVPDMEIRVTCTLTGYTAIADVQARRIVSWKIYARPAGWVPPIEHTCGKEGRT